MTLISWIVTDLTKPNNVCRCGLLVQRLRSCSFAALYEVTQYDTNSDFTAYSYSTKI